MAPIVRAEAAGWSLFFSDAYLEEITWDIILLTLVLVAYGLTWLKAQRSKTCSAQDSKDADKSSSQDRHANKPAALKSPPLAKMEQKDARTRLPNDTDDLIHVLLQTTDRQRGQALEVYRQSRNRIDWSRVSQESKQHVFFNLCLAAARLGRMSALDGLLVEMQGLRISRSQELYTALLKMLTSKRLFKETLMLWERLRKDQVEIVDRSAWSCLLFAATEEREAELALTFFKMLSDSSGLSEKDYGNIVRFHASRQESLQAFDLTQQMRSQGMEPDNYTYNAVFAACCAGGTHLDRAVQLLEPMRALSSCVDTVTYNTLIKGCVQAGRLDDAFAQLSVMELDGVSPSQVTFGTLLDGCIREGCMELTHKVLNHMTNSGCEMNTVLYTTIIKGFVKSNKVEEALEVYEEMRQHGVQPDSITLSLVLKALCDAGRMEDALASFQRMCDEGFQPDEIIFNNLLSGCVVRRNVALGEKLLQDMVNSGVAPSNATFSTLMKLYAECDALGKALVLLSNMETQYGVKAEHRLYTQLLNTCLRMRQRQVSVDVFRQMVVLYAPPEEAEVTKTIRSCISFNLLDVAVQVAELTLDVGGLVNGSTLQMIADAATKKRKTQLVDATLDIARKHGLRVVCR